MLLNRIRSFQSKLLVLVILASVLAALLVGVALLVHEYAGSRGRAIEEVVTLARVHAYHTVAALQFDDPEAALQTLAALEAVENVGSAGVYNAEGEPFARYARGESAPELPPTAPLMHYTSNGWYYAVESIDQEEERLGTIVLTYDLRTIVSRRNLNVLLSILMALLATGIAIAIALPLQRTITKAFAGLLYTAKRVSETQDYSVRARKYEEDELGQFTDVFNEMLRRIDRNNEQIRQANERFRVAVEASPNGMAMVNGRGRIVLVNAQTEQLFGYTREELIGRNVDMLVPKRFREHARFRETFFHQPEARPMGAGRELFGLRKDGTEFPVEIGLNPIETDQGLRVLSSIVDITQRKAAEAAIRESEARKAAILESSIDCLVSMDHEGRIVDFNPAAERTFGYTREEAVGRTVADLLIPTRLREAHWEGLARFLETGEGPVIGKRIEMTAIRKDGTEIPVELAIAPVDLPGGPPFFTAFLRDITERKRAEEAVRESESRLRTLMYAIPAIIWTADANGAATSFNNQWFDYTGLTVAESLSSLRKRYPADHVDRSFEHEAQSHAHGWMKAVHHDDRAECARRWERSVEEGLHFECELRLRRRDGGYRWFLARALPLRDEHGLVIGWFGTTTDIEDRKRAEEERDHLLASERVARSEAERASRAKDEFVATLSHELRTPLTAILGWAQMLRGANLESGQVEQGLEIIHRNARVQTQLIEDLLDMSRIMSGKIRLDVQHVDLPAVIDAAIETVQPGADAKEIRLQKIIDPRSTPVRGDPDRLQQVVWNLLSNAIKFTPRDGRVQVTLQRINSHVEIGVSDTGEGIDPAFLPHIFERFRQADPSTTRRHGGLGLGLAIVKQLVELHGGSITAASPGIGKGATFTIRLPIAVVHAATPESLDEMRHPAAAGPTPGRRAAGVGFGFGRDGNAHDEQEAARAASLTGVKVLLVEDEPDARELISRILAARGAEVEALATGGEALDRLGQFRPDVVVSDIGMPVMDGYEFIRRLRARSREEGGAAPAVALTAFARTEDRTRSLLAGYQMHVAKPVDPGELVASVASLAAMAERRE